MGIGTPGFIAPEQKKGQPIYASDLYSLGSTAIYLLTNKLPQYFPQVNGKFSWHSDAPNINQEFANFLDKSIAENLSDRYSTAEQMLQELNTIQNPKVSNSVLPTKPKIPHTQPSLNLNSTAGNTISINLGNSGCLKIGIVTIIAGIISATIILFYNNTDKIQPQKTPSQNITGREMLDAATQKAETAISTAEDATEKQQLETARKELDIAIQ
ncbi:MAG: hypothetical protein WBA93_29735 [Microcoleaceae cyanobacterium]